MAHPAYERQPHAGPDDWSVEDEEELLGKAPPPPAAAVAAAAIAVLGHSMRAFFVDAGGAKPFLGACGDAV